MTFHVLVYISGLRREEVIRLATRTNNRLGGSPFVTEEITELSDDEVGTL